MSRSNAGGRREGVTVIVRDIYAIRLLSSVIPGAALAQHEHLAKQLAAAADNVIE